MSVEVRLTKQSKLPCFIHCHVFHVNNYVALFPRVCLQEAEILYKWLAALRLVDCYQLFLQAGYDMPTISRMTPEVQLLHCSFDIFVCIFYCFFCVLSQSKVKFIVTV